MPGSLCLRSPRSLLTFLCSRRRTLEELLKEPTIVSFGQFQEAIGLGREDVDAQKKYDEYKLEFAKKGARPFFDEHKSEAWYALSD